MKINLHTFGLYSILLLLMMVLVHKEMAKLFVFYREIFGLVFIVLLLRQRFSDISHSMLNKKVFIEILLLALFPLIIIILALVDPMVKLYGDSLSVGVTSYDGSVNSKLYVFRNAVLYLPMVFYIAVRGLSLSDINKIAGICAFIAPISIIIFMARLSDYSVVSEFVRMITGKIQIEYNTFVPCFTFSVLSIVYLLELNYKKYSLLIKMSLMLILVFECSFIFYSTSRQALLLAIIYISIFLAKNLSVSQLKNILYYTIFVVFLYYLYYWFTLNYGENYRLTSRLSDQLLSSPRIQIAIKGLGLLDTIELFTGAGLTSVLVSGPHNDYIRWIQRIGLIFAFISFYPYFSVMFKSFIDTLSYKKDSAYLYIFCATLFIIYNSFFGYPREDAYQSIFCFLGISMWLGYNNYNQRKKLWMQVDRIP